MSRPFLIVRAAIEDERMREFVAWYVREHLPHVMEIPGIVKAYRSTCRKRGVNWTALYELKDEASVQVAMSSAQADVARRDWETWMPHVSELSVEVFTPLAPMASFHHWN
jgi:hypothetical protein